MVTKKVTYRNLNQPTYRQLQAKLKELRNQGKCLNVKLNASYDALLAEYQLLTTATEVKLAKPEIIVDESFECCPFYPEVANRFEFEKLASLSAIKKQQLLVAFNYELTVFNYILATDIIAIQYLPSSTLWQIKYRNQNNEVKVYNIYDSQLVNALNQTIDVAIEVFEPMAELMEVVSNLKEEFSGVQVKVNNRLVIVDFHSLTLKFLCTTENKLQFLGRYWDYFSCEIGTYYTHKLQMQSLLAQLRSDFWFELEVGVA